MNPSKKINNPEELGQYLFKERKSLKLTQKEIADFSNLECFCMMLANAVGLNVLPVLIARKADQKVLLIKRYDRILDKLTGEIDTAYIDFTTRYQQNSLVEDIVAAIKKRSSKTLQQLNSTPK